MDDNQLLSKIIKFKNQSESIGFCGKCRADTKCEQFLSNANLYNKIIKEIIKV